MQKRVVDLALFLTLCFVSLDYTDGQSRIVGGLPAPAEAAPYHASLQNIYAVHVCGGAIISRKAILSAAHCFVGAKPEYIMAVVGVNDLNSGKGQKYSVSQIIPHEEHNPATKVNDIAVLIMNRRMLFTDFVKPVPILSRYISASETLTLTGFGAKTNPGSAIPNMQTIDLHSLDMETCMYAYRKIRPLFESTQLCTFNAIGEGSCHGDSGGPLVKDDYLVGIASFGVPCAVGYPDVFTRTSAYVPWILEHSPCA